MARINADARDLGIHDELDGAVRRIMQANGWTRTQALSRVVGFCENDPDSPRFTTAPGKPRRPRKQQNEAHA